MLGINSRSIGGFFPKHLDAQRGRFQAHPLCHSYGGRMVNVS